MRRYEASTAKYTRTAFFWDITQQVVVIPCRGFWTSHRSHVQGSRLDG